MVQEYSLKQLLEHEAGLVSEIQGLDSDCQTLVYDHYDKFIAAADIVRKVEYITNIYTLLLYCSFFNGLDIINLE